MHERIKRFKKRGATQLKKYGNLTQKLKKKKSQMTAR